jgi:hypothetical protein
LPSVAAVVVDQPRLPVQPLEQPVVPVVEVGAQALHHRQYVQMPVNPVHQIPVVVVVVEAQITAFRTTPQTA